MRSARKSSEVLTGVTTLVSSVKSHTAALSASQRQLEETNREVHRAALAANRASYRIEQWQQGFWWKVLGLVTAHAVVTGGVFYTLFRLWPLLEQRVSAFLG